LDDPGESSVSPFSGKEKTMKAHLSSFAFASSVALLVVLSVSPAVAAPANSNIATVALNATLNESLTVAVTAGTSINFTLAPNTAANNGSGTSTVVTSWSLKPGRTNIAVWAYFTSAAAALNPVTAGNTVTIPSSAVKIQVNGAGAFNPCSNVSPFNAAASGLQIGATSITGNTNINGTRTDTLAYQIDTTVVPQLPADSYTGVLNIQAQTTP
jgi:sarcosine oxidase gamma subunit